jgi:hypothetical protein
MCTTVAHDCSRIFTAQLITYCTVHVGVRTIGENMYIVQSIHLWERVQDEKKQERQKCPAGTRQTDGSHIIHRREREKERKRHSCGCVKPQLPAYCLHKNLRHAGPQTISFPSNFPSQRRPLKVTYQEGTKSLCPGGAINIMRDLSTVGPLTGFPPNTRNIVFCLVLLIYMTSRLCF